MASHGEEFPEPSLARDSYLDFKPRISKAALDQLYAVRASELGPEQLRPKSAADKLGDGVNAGDGLRYPDPDVWLGENL